MLFLYFVVILYIENTLFFFKNLQKVLYFLKSVYIYIYKHFYYIPLFPWGVGFKRLEL